MRTVRTFFILLLLGIIAVRGGYAIHGQLTHNQEEFNWGMAHALLSLILLFIFCDRVKVKKN